MSDSLAAPADLLGEARRLVEMREWEKATLACQQAIVQGADLPAALGQMAAIAYLLGDLTNAIQLLEQCQEMPGASTDICEVLAVLYARIGRLQEALFYGKLATVHDLDNRLLPLFGPDLPSFAATFLNIQEQPLVARGRGALDAGNAQRAGTFFRQQLELDPQCEEAVAGLAESLMAEGRARGAADLLRSLRTRTPAEPSLASRLGSALAALGRFDEALACHRQAAAFAPTDPVIAAAALRDLDGDPRATRDDRLEWWSRLAPQPAATAVRPEYRIDDDRPLLVGYLCAGIDPAEANDLAAIWRRHDRSRIRVVAYGTRAQSHPRNIVYRNAVDTWQDVAAMDPETIAAVMLGDGVDVLVDVSGLASPETLAVLAHRPAPVQVAWCGHGGPLPAVLGYDYRLGGPAEADDDLPERYPLALPAWHAAVPLPPPAMPSPHDGVLFGADAGLAELNPEVVLCWATLLVAEPEARLRLLDRDLRDPANADRLREIFGNFGVSHRIEVVAADTPRDFFRDVDVALTPFPRPRPRSALEALVCGVPAVVLDAPQWPCGRIAEALRQMAVDGPTVARSLGEYIEKAVTLARAAGDRAALRDSLPAIVSASPVTDAATLASALDQAYWEMARAAARRSSP